MIVDVSTFVGHYAYRLLPDTTPGFLLREMDRIGIGQAWVGDLSSFLYRDPAPSIDWLVRALDGFGDRLRPVPTVHPGLPKWPGELERVRDLGAPAIRVYPMHQGVDPTGTAMKELVNAAAEVGIPVVLTVRFEDVRQRHPIDVTPDFPPSAVRALARVGAGVRLLVANAKRAFIEEVHFGLTTEEAHRVLWDITWLWGPPDNELEAVVTSVGGERFTFGTSMPLRIPDAAPAKLDLTKLPEGVRTGIESANLGRWVQREP